MYQNTVTQHTSPKHIDRFTVNKADDQVSFSSLTFQLAAADAALSPADAALSPVHW